MAYVRNNILEIELFNINMENINKRNYSKLEIVKFQAVKYFNKDDIKGNEEKNNDQEDNQDSENVDVGEIMNYKKIHIGGMYRINIIGNSIILFNSVDENAFAENTIYRIDVSKDKKYNNENYNIDIIAHNVKNVQFINNDDYFYSTEKEIFFYDYNKNESFNCNIALENKLESVLIINRNLFLQNTKEIADEWYIDLKESFIGEKNPQIIDIDEIKIRNYFEIYKFEISNEGKNKYDNLKQWQKEVYDVEIKKRNDEKMKFLSAYKSRWNISSPDDEIFINYDKGAKNNDIKKVNISKRLSYKGNDSYIKYLIDIYYKTIEFYSNSNLTSDTQKQVNDMYIAIRNELFTIIEK
jgi:hypothetical protein